MATLQWNTSCTSTKWLSAIVIIDPLYNNFKSKLLGHSKSLEINLRRPRKQKERTRSIILHLREHSRIKYTRTDFNEKLIFLVIEKIKEDNTYFLTVKMKYLE